MFGDTFENKIKNICLSKKRIKNIVVKCFLSFVFVLLVFSCGWTSQIDGERTEEEITADISGQIENQLENLDFGNLDEILKNMSLDEKKNFWQ